MQPVVYFELPELPGKRMFNCERRRATLMAERCSAMWQAGHVKGAHERFLACRGCQIGAMHAGAAEATLSPLYASCVCGRCSAGATRLIHGHLCVSCYNREREYLKGRNAKGNVPVMHPPLHRLVARYMAGGKVKTRVIEHAVGMAELVFAVLRDEPKQATFGAYIPRPVAVRQLELFA